MNAKRWGWVAFWTIVGAAATFAIVKGIESRNEWTAFCAEQGMVFRRGHLTNNCIAGDGRVWNAEIMRDARRARELRK